MSSTDPIAAVFAGFDRPAEPRAAFALALRERLLEELAGGRRLSAAGRPAPPRVTPRLRLAFVVVALLLLLAGIATATYVGVRTWVSAGPRGPQFASDYRFAQVLRVHETAFFWSSWALDPGGHDLYALRMPRGLPGPPELWRIGGVDAGTGLRGTRVLDYRRLSRAAWSVEPGPDVTASPPQPLAVAPGGDVFLVAAGRDAGGVRPSLRVGSTALFVLHRGGSTQLVVGARALVRTGVLPRRPMVWSVAATASDRLWLLVDLLGSRAPDPTGARAYARYQAYRLLEVVDPNADGDWGDRVVRPIDLPGSLPPALRGRMTINSWSWVQLAAEPAVSGGPRGRSVLAAAFLGGDYRVYRLGDLDDDGDALDRGEALVVLERSVQAASGASIAPQVVHEKGREVRRLVVGGLVRQDRVSVVSEAGAAVDVARAFPPEHVLAGPKGVIYGIGSTVPTPSSEQWTVVRLQPAAGEGVTAAGAPAERETRMTVSLPSGLDGDGSRLLVQPPGGGVPSTARIDGTGLQPLVSGLGPGTRISGVCLSADGKALVYGADAEAPNEFFLYLAGEDGHARKVTERQLEPGCPFSRRWLVLHGPGPGGGGALLRRDLRTGSLVRIAGPVDRFAVSPDGARVAFVAGDDYGTVPAAGHETLEVVDLTTLRRHRLAGPLARARVGDYYPRLGLRWSPDGTRIAYVTGPGQFVSGFLWRRFRYVVWVRDAVSGQALFRRTVVGGPPSLFWAPDGTRLLVCAEVSGNEPGCSGAAYPRHPGRLLLIDLPHGRVLRELPGMQLVWAGWSPSGHAFAYATVWMLFVDTPDGRNTRRVPAPGGHWPAGRVRNAWLGWSPDGRFIGLPGGHGLVDVRTGRVRSVPVLEKASPPFDVRWWGSPAGG
jgi:hypothetical protein